LEKISLPWQLYITLPAPDEEIYLKICRPLIESGWEKINKTLELFPSLDCRKAIRLTLVKDLNLKEPEKYAKLIEKTNCDFVECKSYMHVGESQKRLKKENMPSMEEIREFSLALSKLIGYKYKDEDLASRVVLLTRK
ncbi:MAG: 4-demethylwyosine synthase TYW1, partial [Candidatus Aenigmatarchaeota archaeon]